MIGGHGKLTWDDLAFFGVEKPDDVGEHVDKIELMIYIQKNPNWEIPTVGECQNEKVCRAASADLRVARGQRRRVLASTICATVKVDSPSELLEY